MNQPRAARVRIAIDRADYCPLASLDATIIKLDVDHVFVVTNIEPGLVTISISKDFDEDSGADHIEIEHEPAAAVN